MAVKRFVAALLLLPSAAGAATGDSATADGAAVDAARGKVIAEVRCTPCHHLDRTTLRIGPGLKGVYGRKPTISGVPFSHWDAAALDAWIHNPRAIKPNTEMVRLPISARDRADLIAYFKSESREGTKGN